MSEISLSFTMANETADAWLRLASGLAARDQVDLLRKVIALAVVVEGMADRQGLVEIRNPSTGAVRKVSMRSQ